MAEEWKDEKLKKAWKEYWDEKEKTVESFSFPYDEIGKRAIEIVRSSEPKNTDD